MYRNLLTSSCLLLTNRNCYAAAGMQNMWKIEEEIGWEADGAGFSVALTSGVTVNKSVFFRPSVSDH